jgi:hypothetical protein
MKIEEYFKDNQFIDLPIRNKINLNFNEHVSINCGQNLFVDYSNNHFQMNSLENNYSNNQTNIYQNNYSNNILSSSIQAGLNNRVQTTTTRTDDGKFLTTISTIPKINNENSNSNQLNNQIDQNQLLFGQSNINNQTFKRTFQQDSNSLSSLTKKVLQIENDRQSIQQ